MKISILKFKNGIHEVIPTNIPIPPIDGLGIK
jgi:hypothetical protein